MEILAALEGDEVTLPAALVVRVFAQGRFDEVNHLIAVGMAPAGWLSLKGGKCMQFNVLFDPADGRVNSVDTDIGRMTVPDMPDKCKAFVPQVKPGTMRAAVEKQLQPDGGITMPFRYERYVMPNSACGPKGESIKINLAFKPAGMSDVIYFWENGLHLPQTPTIPSCAFHLITWNMPFLISRPPDFRA